MPRIIYIEHDGTEHRVNVQTGQSVMQGAVDNGVRGIVADCGGVCSCATCHVYVDEAWLEKTGDKSEIEAVMLEEVCDPQPTSRLSCQLEVSEALDGLVVRVPARQF